MQSIYGRKIRAGAQIANLTRTNIGPRLTVVHRLERDATWCVPVSLVYTEMGRFFFSLDGPDQNMGMDWFSWKEIGKSKGSNVKKKIECSNTCGDPPVYLDEPACL